MVEDPNKKSEERSEEEQAERRRKVRVLRRRNLRDEHEELEEAAGEIDDFRHALFTMTPWIFVTKLLVAANVLYFVTMAVSGVNPLSPQIEQIVSWGGNYGPYTLGGEWWRLVSCTFIHIGLMHLLFNMWVLWDLGQLVERLVGPVGFLFLYMLSGIGGSIASVAWNPQVVSAGASGAVFGVLGAMLGFVILRRDTIPQSVFISLRNTGLLFFGINFVLGMSIKAIDQAAHMGGFGVGLVCGLILSQPVSLDPAIRANRAFRNGLMAVAASLLIIGGGMLFVRPHIAKTASFKHFRAGVQLVLKADKAHAALDTSVKTKKLSDKAYNDGLTQQILPAWDAGLARLKKVKADDLGHKKKRLYALLLHYATLKRDSIALWSKGLKENNAALRKQAIAKKQAANRLVSQIETLLK